MKRKLLKHVGDNKNMIIFVESSTFFQRLFKKPTKIIKYVGSSTVWYVLPEYMRAPTTDEMWLFGQWTTIINDAKNLELLHK